MSKLSKSGRGIGNPRKKKRFEGSRRKYRFPVKVYYAYPCDELGRKRDS